MATHQPSMLGNFLPDATGNAFVEPYPLKATNDIFKGPVLILNDSGAECGIYGFYHVPQNYVGSAVVKPIWTSTAIAGNVVLEFSYRAISGDDAESMDQATFQETGVTVTDAAPSAVNERNVPSIGLTSANIAAGDTLEYYFYRDGLSASDTMAAAAIVFDLIFEYADV